LRILKTLETIGFFNEFKEGALSVYYQKEIPVERAIAYINTYVLWREIDESEDPTAKATASGYRQELKRLEDTTTYEYVEKLRQFGIQKYKDQLDKQKEVDGVNAKIKEGMDEQIGYGLFIS